MATNHNKTRKQTIQMATNPNKIVSLSNCRIAKLELGYQHYLSVYEIPDFEVIFVTVNFADHFIARPSIYITNNFTIKCN